MLKTVAGVQTDVSLGDKSANLRRMFEWLDSSMVGEADLVVFPECMLTGYCFRSLTEGSAVAETIPGPATDAMAEHCRQRNRFVAFGMLEVSPTGELYNACPVVGPDGVVGVYRKLHLPFLGIDRFVKLGVEPFRVYDLGGMRVGVHICYDGSFPESSRIMALQGADLLILPTNWPPGANTFARYLPNARALENNVFYMSVNRVGTERGFRFIGNSRLCNVDGEPISECGGTDEGVVVGRIDLEAARMKRLVRVPGEHVIDRMADRRPELYGLISEPHQLRRPVDDLG